MFFDGDSYKNGYNLRGYAFSKAKKIGRAYYVTEPNLIAFLEHEQR